MLRFHIVILSTWTTEVRPCLGVLFVIYSCFFYKDGIIWLVHRCVLQCHLVAYTTGCNTKTSTLAKKFWRVFFLITFFSKESYLPTCKLSKRNLFHPNCRAVSKYLHKKGYNILLQKINQMRMIFCRNCMREFV